MIQLHIHVDELLQNSLNQIISGLLPHSGYESTLYSEILRLLTKYIPLDDFHGEYYCIVSSLLALKDIGRSIPTYKPELSYDTLNEILSINIPDLVRNPKVRIEELLDLNGLSPEIEIEENFNKACELLYTRTLELFEDCYELNVPSTEAINKMLTLKDSFILHVAEQSIQAQAQILKGIYKVKGRTYAGPADWLRYNAIIQKEIKERLDIEDDTTLKLDSVEKSVEMQEKVQFSNMPLANYDIPPLDDKTPMLRHRLVIIAANENTGKTMFAIDKSVNLILEGKKVVFMCGETSYENILPMFYSNYIYKKFNMFVTPDDVVNFDTLPDHIKRLVSVTKMEFVEKKCLTLKKYFGYETLYDELRAMYEVDVFDAVMIDHSYALRGIGTERDKLSALATNARNFKKDYPVYIMILSHLSTDAKAFLAKGQYITASPTKGNSALSAEADEILILSSNEVLAKQKLIQVQNYKRRNAEKIIDYIYLTTKFEVCTFTYDEKLQNQNTEMELEIDKIESIYTEDNLLDDGDYLSDDFEL